LLEASICGGFLGSQEGFCDSVSVKMDSSFIGVAGQQQVVHGGAYRDVMVPQKRKWRNNSGSNQRFRKRSKTQQQQQGEKLTVVRAAAVYDPPRLKDLQRQNRLKTRKYFPRRRKSVPSAPFNNSSFLMRVRRSGGLASIVSPATPAFLTTPVFSPAPNYGREGGLVEEVKDLGVNGYGSMAGFIHLRAFDDDDDDDEQPTSTATAVNESRRMVIAQPPSSSTSAQSSVQQLEQRLEQRLDRDVSRFEMTYPSSTHGMNNSSQLLEVRLAEQEGHIAYLEDENLTLKERLFLIQQELTELRQRVVQGGGVSAVVDEHEDACSDYGSSD